MADDKKRKRTSGGDKPSKKVATGDINVTFADAQGELHPVIASTQGLNLPSSVFKPFAKSHSNKSQDAPTPSTHSLLLHSSSHPKSDYTAHPSSNDLQTHYIGVFDPATSSLKIIPAHATTLRSTLRSETAEVRALAAARTYAQQREESGMEFGTKKAKKALSSRTENAITSSADRARILTSPGGTERVRPDAVEAAVSESVKEAAAALPARQESQDSASAAKPIPKPYLAAQKVEDVYALDVSVPKAEMRNSAVKEWEDSVGQNEEVKVTSRFVASRVRNVVKRGDVQQLKALKYSYLSLEFNAALRPAGKAGKKVPIREQLRTKMAEWSEGSVDGVRKRFSQNGELNKWHMDNLITHIAALTLYIDNYRTDTHDIREDLGLDNKVISQYFHESGCKVAPPTEKEQSELGIPNKAVAAQRRIAKSKSPLDFPRVRNPPRRR